mgnify:FL=1
MPWDVLLDALLDTLKILPFLLAIFILISVLEHCVSAKKHTKLLGGKFAPLIGAGLGVIPQCGLSVMAVKLFQENCITVGALIAIFLSTSDEAVPVLISAGRWKEFLLLIGLKVIIGIIVGYAVDFIIKKKPNGVASEHTEEHEEFSCCHHSGDKNESNLHKFFLHPLIHCLKTAGYILAVNVILGIIVWAVGEDKFKQFVLGAGYFQPFVAALIGLIPNCASSVILTETFVSGSLSFGGLLAGLCANAGVGLALLFKDKDNVKRNLAILAVLYTVGVVAGEICTAIELLI